MLIEDLHSANGTYVDQHRVPPGEKRPLRMGDIIQVGAVQLKVLQ
jgi:pSer/pThr/pTyr-binding forkhead associated (FHA) protein